MSLALDVDAQQGLPSSSPVTIKVTSIAEDGPDFSVPIVLEESRQRKFSQTVQGRHHALFEIGGHTHKFGGFQDSEFAHMTGMLFAKLMKNDVFNEEPHRDLLPTCEWSCRVVLCICAVFVLLEHKPLSKHTMHLGIRIRPDRVEACKQIVQRWWTSSPLSTPLFQKAPGNVKELVEGVAFKVGILLPLKTKPQKALKAQKLRHAANEMTPKHSDLSMEYLLSLDGEEATSMRKKVSDELLRVNETFEKQAKKTKEEIATAEQALQSFIGSATYERAAGKEQLEMMDKEEGETKKLAQLLQEKEAKLQAQRKSCQAAQAEAEKLSVHVSALYKKQAEAKESFDGTLLKCQNAMTMIDERSKVMDYIESLHKAPPTKAETSSTELPKQGAADASAKQIEQAGEDSSSFALPPHIRAGGASQSDE